MGKVVFDLAAHPFDLLRDRGRKHRLPFGPGALRLLVQQRQRRLQSMRQIAGLGQSARDALLAIDQQRVQLGNQRLHFRRVLAAEARVTSFPNAGEIGAQLIERREAAFHLDEPDDHARHRRECHDDHVVHEHVVKGTGRLGHVQHVVRQDQAAEKKQAEAPEHGAKEDAHPQ